MVTRKTTRRYGATRKHATRKSTMRRSTGRRNIAGTPWSKEEISFMRKYYRNNETAWCARQLGRSVYSVRYKASDLSIRKANPSKWKNPPKGKVYFGYKTRPTTRRPVVYETRGRDTAIG